MIRMAMKARIKPIIKNERIPPIITKTAPNITPTKLFRNMAKIPPTILKNRQQGIEELFPKRTFERKDHS